MLWWLRELLACFRFLSITGHDSFWRSKRVYELVLPASFATLGLVLFELQHALFADDFLSKLSGSLFQFMVFVVPFHLAALAAVATFARGGLDEQLKGVAAQLKVWSNADNSFSFQTLTLRQYTCLLFGYLCSIGIAFILVYVISTGINFALLLGSWSDRITSITVFALLFFLAHYGTLSIYAITFLFDKVNGIDPP
ncbi:hypothetical protein OE766_03680 [Pararhizobium sp. YC-54]|uniref:hypothetical protein n=1 Tax=Pararhizobium sp. YC-54 TaxID=2986920 RepID=UPI0021F6B095|nr:hypothetical protein [Pararhizobium sp. YC-54]MCV9997338.1 hypothetical protein [Pararhizobium sp. YC-54]